MGRRNHSAEKKELIVTAFCDCVSELGIQRATMGEVANRVGLDRSSLHYYFRTREELVALATLQTSRHYADAIVQAVSKVSPNDRAKSLVDLLFGPTFHDSRRSRLLAEIESQGLVDPFYTEQIKAMFQRFELSIFKVLEESFPKCPVKERKMVSLAMAQLCEGSTEFAELGFSSAARLAARQMALIMLGYLEQRSARARGAWRRLGRLPIRTSGF
jgi:TetR/AcrR family transcriptional regulator, transcriptional repressor of bet genes